MQQESMELMVITLKLRPGMADVLKCVAKALGTMVEDVLAMHLDAFREVMSDTIAD